MNITLEFNNSYLQRKDPEHLKGLLLSFLDVLDDILLRRRNATYLVQFYQERLDKNERKMLQIFFEKNIERLSRRKNLDPSVSESLDLEDSKLPLEYQEILEFFKKSVVSVQTTGPHQSPKVGETTSGGGKYV